MSVSIGRDMSMSISRDTSPVVVRLCEVAMVWFLKVIIDTIWIFFKKRTNMVTKKLRYSCI